MGEEIILKKRILVIEDDISIKKYLVSLLKDQGYDVYEASDVKEGLSQAERYRPDLITLDIEMPGDWGPRFYHYLEKDPGLKKIVRTMPPSSVVTFTPRIARKLPTAFNCDCQSE